MTPNRLITLAIHTIEKALPIKNLLESEGIYVELNNVNLSSPQVAAGVRIRIKESDLPLALRIVENIEIFSFPKGEAPQEGVVLVPTDFSAYSDKAARLAAYVAPRTNASVMLLHSYLAPSTLPGIQPSDNYDLEVMDAEEVTTLEKDSEKMMADYLDKVRGWIKSGDIPAVKFDSYVTEGIPEEVILDYARSHTPQMVVMGTRGADRKGAEMIGSVTAEVLDSCRLPAFTVPENVDLTTLEKDMKVAFICNLDQEDMIALDTLYRTLHETMKEVTLIHVPGRRVRNLNDPRVVRSQNNLLTYCREHFDGCKFEIRTVSLDTLIDDFRDIMKENDYQLICVPNKKRTVFARVFNPSIAHKILFRADVAMMVIPV